mgnify:CR=1 FL=1
MASIKGGRVAHSRLAVAAGIDRKYIPTDRSGGGV